MLLRALLTTQTTYLQTQFHYRLQKGLMNYGPGFNGNFIKRKLKLFMLFGGHGMIDNLLVTNRRH